MYTFSSKLKTFSIVLMVVGLLGIGYGFLTAPKTIQDVEHILAAEAAHGGHGAGHENHSNASTEAHNSHKPDAHQGHTDDGHTAHSTATKDSVSSLPGKEKIADLSKAEGKVDTQNKSDKIAADSSKVENTALAEGNKKKEVGSSSNYVASQVNDEHENHDKHLEHVLHQLQNKPWAAVYVACLFFMLIALGVLVFYAIQQVAQAGWSPLLFRVMQGISAYLLPGSIIFFALLLLSGFHINHLFVWMDETVRQTDKLIIGKAGYLNFSFWIIRAAIFLVGWNLYRYYSRRNDLAQDEGVDNAAYKRNFKLSAAFLVFFIVTESISSWDWIMSLDPHWFSTLFGWYVFASFFVSGITVICMFTLYLKSRGYLEHVNTSHIHDLAKFMFGISVFWTYLWFSQFMLIWYANIPEEVTYFVTRIEHYNITFFGAVVMNFVLPVLMLINTDFKRVTWILVMAGSVILIGHYIDFFNMVMPATVGDQWFIGAAELGALSFFGGLFIFVAFTALSKAPLVPKRNPFIEESKHFHY